MKTGDLRFVRMDPVARSEKTGYLEWPLLVTGAAYTDVSLMDGTPVFILEPYIQGSYGHVRAFTAYGVGVIERRWLQEA